MKAIIALDQLKPIMLIIIKFICFIFFILCILFIAQSVICQNSNFRLSVKLASTHRTTSTDNVSNGSVTYIKKSNLTDHYEKCKSLIIICFFTQNPYINV